MSEPTLTRFLLALAIYREARGESFLGKLLVGTVIRNRVIDPRWPDTYRGVILQAKQFSAFNQSDPNVTLFPLSEEEPAWRNSLAAADCVLAAPSTITTANHYHTTAVSPAWKDETKIVAREGAHVFYTL